ncbi:MAG: hypothetical protein ACK559_23395, partial [bacterium]
MIGGAALERDDESGPHALEAVGGDGVAVLRSGAPGAGVVASAAPEVGHDEHVAADAQVLAVGVEDRPARRLRARDVSPLVDVREVEGVLVPDAPRADPAAPRVAPDLDTGVRPARA